MQPYEAHLSYFMHFYGDYNLSGMDFLKITEFQIRHLDTLDDKLTISQLSFYPIHFNQGQMSDESIEIQSIGSRESQFPGFKKVREQSSDDFSFLQSDNYLKIYHADMSEILEHTEHYISPYNRQSSCQIEIDCSCKDILNIWETDNNIVGDSSIQDPHSSQLYRRSEDSNLQESFANNYITPFKTPEQVHRQGSIPQFNTIGMQSQQSFHTVNNDELMMSIKIDHFDRQRTQQVIKDYSESYVARFNSMRQHSNHKQFTFSQQYYEEPEKNAQTPSFHKNQSEVSFDQEFASYAKDIKEVRSLVNLWKEEFIRRKTQPDLPTLEKAVMSDNSRIGGYSQNILNKEGVAQFLNRHLHTVYKSETYQDVSNELYKHLEPINYNAVKAILNINNHSEEEQGRTRWFREGIGSMRQLHEQRQNKAVIKGMQQQIDEEPEQDQELEVLDIMDSLKDQFQNLSEKYSSYREGKSKYKTGKIVSSDTVNNKKIFDYYSSPTKKLQIIEEEKTEQSVDNPSITLDQLALIDSNFASELQMSELQDALYSLQNSDIKQKQLMNVSLEEVKEEQSCEENSYMSEIASLFSEKLSIEQTSPQQAVAVTRHVLKGDKMLLEGSPRKTQPTDFKHQKAFFSSKDDLLQHLNEVRRIRNNKKIQLKDLKIEITDQNKREIEIDLSIQRESAFKYVDQITSQTLIFNKQAPKSSLIKAKYNNKSQDAAYENKLCNIIEQKPDDEEIKDDHKLRIKNQIIKESKKNHRFVTPATQYDLKHLDSQVNIGGFEKHRDSNSQRNQLSLFDIHKKFDEIYGLTILAIEVLVMTRPGMTPNYDIDAISAVYFVIHNECADLDQGKHYNKINGAIFNKQDSLLSNENTHLGSYNPLTYVKYAKNEISLMNHIVDLFR